MDGKRFDESGLGLNQESPRIEKQDQKASNRGGEKEEEETAKRLIGIRRWTGQSNLTLVQGGEKKRQAKKKKTTLRKHVEFVERRGHGENGETRFNTQENSPIAGEKGGIGETSPRFQKVTHSMSQ